MVAGWCLAHCWVLRQQGRGSAPFGAGSSVRVCFWFPGCTDYTVWFPLWGLVCGVCGTGLLFENYIVDASIFYKKQFLDE